MNGFKVETAGDGAEARTRFKGGVKPDLILADINMLNMGGLELIKSARALPGADPEGHHRKPLGKTRRGQEAGRDRLVGWSGQSHQETLIYFFSQCFAWLNGGRLCVVRH